jgi:hypothetical protein
MPHEVEVLKEELRGVKAQRQQVKVDMLKTYSSTLAEVAVTLEERERELEATLAKTAQKLAAPESDAWDDAHSLIDVLDSADAPGDARVRLRAALRRTVATVTLLVVPRGRDRLAAVQIDFANGGRRSYLILSRPPKSNGKAMVPGGWWARSLARDAAESDLDLRQVTHAQALERQLEALDLDEFVRSVEGSRPA